MTHLMANRSSDKARVHIRWMIRRDFAEVIEIEKENFEVPWTKDDFAKSLRQRNVIGLVAESTDYGIDDYSEYGAIAGFVVYQNQRTRLDLLSMAVAKKYQRRGIGQAMVTKLADKLSDTRRRRIVCEVRETNLDAQLFFKAMGFRAVNVLRDFYQDTDEDAYVFSFVNQPRDPDCGPPSF